LRQCFLTTPAVHKHLYAGARRAGIELWRAKVPKRDIMKQLGMSKATLMRVLAFCDSNSDYLRNLVTSMPRRLAEVIEKDGWTTHYLSVHLHDE
jgi:hypothetical protein